MKKLIALLLALVMVLALAACGAGDENPTDGTTTAPTTAPTTEPVADPTTKPAEDPTDEATDPSGSIDAVKVMTHEEYMNAAVDDAVCVETYVQATQSWWDNKISVYCQSEDGAYFLYEMACSEEDAAKLTPGTKIRVSGFKAEWSGEVEIVDATFEFVEGEAFIATALDVTDLLGTDELYDHQNEFVSFSGLTVEKIEYKNDEPGDDIYVTVSKDGASYSFCVERYLTDPDTAVYQTVGTLEAGDVVDIQGFLYWYEGVNPHITQVTVVE